MGRYCRKRTILSPVHINVSPLWSRPSSPKYAHFITDWMQIRKNHRKAGIFYYIYRSRISRSGNLSNFYPGGQSKHSRSWSIRSNLWSYGWTAILYSGRSYSEKETQSRRNRINRNDLHGLFRTIVWFLL